MTVNNSKRKRIHLAMFAKYWEAGKVKTRLARSIGEESARDIHLLFVRVLLQKFRTFGDQRTLVGSPANKKQEFEEILPDSWQLQFQTDGDLGTRMSHFFASNENEDQLNILIGSDAPDLRSAYLDQVVRLLETNQLVLGPSRDGGYYLIAMRRHLAGVFQGIEWSSPEVLSRTIELARQQSISFALLPELNDVDDVNDLRQLLEGLGESQDEFARQLFESLSQMELSLAE